MVEEFGADEVRAQALNIIGISTVEAGRPEGLADLERCIEITARSGSPRASPRLHQSRLDAQRARRARAQLRGARQGSERSGAVRQRQSRCAGSRPSASGTTSCRGRWNEAEASARMRSCRMQGRVIPDYMATAALLIRALIRLARGDSAAALEDSDAVLGLARAAADPQVVIPSLAFHSHMLLATDHRADAGALLDELIGVGEPSRAGSSPTGLSPASSS